MQSRNKHRSLVLSSTFVGLVCGLVLTHQQAYAAQTPSVSNQESQITAVAAPNNNLNKTAAVNQAYTAENIANSAASGNVTPNTYSSLQTNAITKQDSSLQITNSDATAAVATPNTGAAAPVDNGTTTSTNPENNNSTNPDTSLPSPDTGNSASTPVAASDNQTTGNSNTTSTSSEQPDTNIIDQGTWGTSKWDYTQEGDDYILHLHTGTLGTPQGDEGVGSLNVAFWQQLTQIIIDPGVIANQNSRGLFSYLSNLKTIQGLENLDTSQVTDMSYMFYGCERLTNLDVSHFDTSQVRYMDWMFSDCYNLTSLDVSHFNTYQVIEMTRMFYYCENLADLDVSHFDTSQVTDMGMMFTGCYNLTNLDVSHFDTSQVTNMSFMFYYCENLADLDVSHFDTSRVTDMPEMFADCKNLTSLDLSSFDTSPLVNSKWVHFSMLAGCTNLHHLVLGPKIQLIDQNGWISDLPAVPAAGTKIPGTDKTVTAPYWVATSGYQQGKRYTSDELQQLTGRDQVTTYDWASQPLFASTVNSKVVTRTINVHNPDGTTHSEKQTAMLSQEIKNNADGTQTVGPWSTAQWAAYAIPEIAGYTANPSTVAAQTVNEKTQEQTVDVYYEPVLQQITVNYLDNGKIVGTQILTGYAGETIIPQYRAPKGYEILDQPQGQVSFTTAQQQIIQVAVQARILKTSETKSLIRTVNIHRPSGTIQTYRQPVVLMRTVYVNAVNGAKSYGSWSVGSWDAVPVPVITGYTASQAQVAAQQVTAQDSDQLLDIYYTKA
ncbi:BspA family leucine-rich repeat surface protein [Lactobacillus mellis]|nr:BspA family leucine-rich repeat surface protein [Bombilactobacillus mellis]